MHWLLRVIIRQRFNSKKYFFRVYFYKSKVNDDGHYHYISDLASMAQDFLDDDCPYCLSTTKDKKWVSVLLQKNIQQGVLWLWSYCLWWMAPYHSNMHVWVAWGLAQYIQLEPEFSIDYVTSPSTNHDVGWCWDGEHWQEFEQGRGRELFETCRQGKENFQFCQKTLCQSFIPTDENLASYRGNSDS